MPAFAQSPAPLPAETQLVTIMGAPAATEETFTIPAVASGTQPDLIVTITDFQTPAPIATATVIVTQGAAIVGMTTMATPATTATLALPAAVGQYTLRVIGTPGTAGVGTFSVCVAPAATPAACIQGASLAGNITVQSTAADPTLSTLAATLTVTTAGTYTFTYADEQFPVALNVAPSLALFQGSQPIMVPVPASPAAITLGPGTYTLLALAQADPAAQAGLYGINITGPPTVAPLLSSSYPVGLLAPASLPNNPSAQPLTLTVTDFLFPFPLGSSSALVSAGGTALGIASAGGAPAAFMAPAGPLQVWSYGAAGTGAGTYEVDLISASASLLQSAFGVSSGNSFAYAFVSPQPLTAGNYQAAVNDFQFPAALSAVQFAVAQNDVILKQLNSVGSVNFTAATGPVVLLVDAAPTAANSNGLFDVNVQTSGNAPQLVFDQVQPVSAAGGFTSQTITLGTSGSFDVTLADLKFPAQFATLALVGSSAGAVLGKIYGGGTFTIAATPANYQFNVIAIPAAQQQYGLYGVQVVYTAPTVNLSASPTTVQANKLTTLNWTTANATSCAASGGGFVGPQPPGSGTLTVVVAATTTYMLTCMGPGGSVKQSVTVTATPAPAGSGGGGGGIGAEWLCLLAALAACRLRSMPFQALKR